MRHRGKPAGPVFGKSEWFTTTHGGLGIHPVKPQGWLFLIGWVAAILFPTAAFLLFGKGIESAIWCSLSTLVLIRESRGLVREKQRENVFVIGEETDVTKVTTNNYDLELRQ
jgi:hypothetical protein